MPNGYGGYRSMKMALIEAGLSPYKIDHVNCHATSTIVGDTAQLFAIQRLLGLNKLDDFEYFKESSSKQSIECVDVDKQRLRKVKLTANKSQLGHGISAAGGMESVIAVQTIKNGIIPKILNLENQIQSRVELVKGQNKREQVNYVMKNSFGFGGINTSLVFENVNNQ